MSDSAGDVASDGAGGGDHERFQVLLPSPELDTLVDPPGPGARFRRRSQAAAAPPERVSDFADQRGEVRRCRGVTI